MHSEIDGQKVNYLEIEQKLNAYIDEVNMIQQVLMHLSNGTQMLIERGSKISECG